MRGGRDGWTNGEREGEMEEERKGEERKGGREGGREERKERGKEGKEVAQKFSFSKVSMHSWCKITPNEKYPPSYQQFQLPSL